MVVVRRLAGAAVTSIKGGPDQDGLRSRVGPIKTDFDQAWAQSDRARSSLGPIETAPRSGLGGHADRVEGGLEASDRAIDVAELVEAEQPDAERREVLGFAALQGNSSRDLHPGFLEARSVGQLRVVGVDDDHAG